MQLLVTRPEPDAKRTAAALRARGHRVVIAPLLGIEPFAGTAIGPGPWAAVLVTSVNVAQVMAGHARRADFLHLPIFAVGDRTAQAMRALGAAHVISAGGNAGDLARIVAAHLNPPARLLYLAGEQRSGDLGGELRAQRFCGRDLGDLSRSDRGHFAAGGRRCFSGRYRRRAAFLAPQRRGVCASCARRGPARKCAAAGAFLPLRPGRGAAAKRRRRASSVSLRRPPKPRCSVWSASIQVKDVVLIRIDPICCRHTSPVLCVRTGARRPNRRHALEQP